MQPCDIVVGYDGSAQSRAALRYAAIEARRRNARVRVLTVFDYDWRGTPSAGVDRLDMPVRQRIQLMVDRAVAEARRTTPGVSFSGTAVVGSPAVVLTDASRTASLVVVGNRDDGARGGRTLGSVSRYVATHAHCAVLVVRGRVDTPNGRVVVGVDRSARAEHTLGVAFDEAARRGADLIAIRTYDLPVPYGAMPTSTMPLQPNEIKLAESTALRRSVKPWREKYPDVTVQMLVAEGGAGRVLAGVSGSAGLIVVGSHSRSVISGTLLGSVALQLLHQANCPVLVVRDEPTQPLL
jgi:nucleotide-binding universal stress UspA family protein